MNEIALCEFEVYCIGIVSFHVIYYVYSIYSCNPCTKYRVVRFFTQTKSMPARPALFSSKDELTSLQLSRSINLPTD